MVSQPRSPKELFWVFTFIAIQGFGGVMTIIQREMVEKRKWFTQEQFVQDWAVAQILPGPNVMNVALVLGNRFFGWRGALAAAAGLLAFPLILIIALSIGYRHVADIPSVAGALRGLGLATAGMIAATAAKMLIGLKNHPFSQWGAGLVAVLAFLAVAAFKVPLIYVVLALGLPSCLLLAFMLKRQLGSEIKVLPKEMP